MTVVLKPGQTTLAQLEQIWRSGDIVRLHPEARPQLRKLPNLLRRRRLEPMPFMALIRGLGSLQMLKLRPKIQPHYNVTSLCLTAAASVMRSTLRRHV